MAAENPFVAIIIPVRNESRNIERTLSAILTQDYPPDRMEVIVVDGMSTDGTRLLLVQMARRETNISMKVLDNHKKIVPTAMNIALRQANGEVIIRVDGHTIIAKDYVKRCVEALRKSNADNVGGKMIGKGQSYIGNVIAVATGTPFGVGGARFHYSDKEEWVDTVYMGAWHRKVFEKIGFFIFYADC